MKKLKNLFLGISFTLFVFSIYANENITQPTESTTQSTECKDEDLQKLNTEIAALENIIKKPKKS
ncbi:MAG: hypothetical protein US49_C0003G0077 [candidate division TM6 bacterium GW2011_GWF2_37_49]|nr:MAG: hypothetical protein US49_C0003G0077 [candidate division TM6 bacterium GW2011_GWF2_37_49]